MTFPNVRSDWARHARQLGEAMMGSMGLAAYCVILDVIRATYSTVDTATPSGWLNLQKAIEDGKTGTSKSMMIAHHKATELLVRHTKIVEHEVRCTPILTDPEDRGSGFLGGVQIERRIIAISGLPQHHDRFVAAVMHMATFNELKVGFDRMASRINQPVVVLKSADPDFVLDAVSSICGVPRFSCALAGVNSPGKVLVHAEDGEIRGPRTLGLVVEKV